MRNRLFGAVAVSLLALASITACTPGVSPTGAPAADPTPAPTPSETTLPPDGAGGGGDEHVADSIFLGGSSVILAEGALVLLEVPYSTDPATAAAQISDVLGVDPLVTDVPIQGNCQPAKTVYEWGGFSLWAPGSFNAAPGATFIAHATGATTAEGVPVQMTYTQHVGSLEADVVSLPGVVVEDGGGWTNVYYHVNGDVLSDPSTWAPDMETWGGYALVRGGVVESISSPIHYFYDC